MKLENRERESIVEPITRVSKKEKEQRMQTPLFSHVEVQIYENNIKKEQNS